MNKCICDVCCDRPSDKKFKIKKEQIISYEFLTNGYVPIDICERCYRRLMSVYNDKKTENLIWDFTSSNEHLKKYADEDMQSAYLSGFEAVISLLIQKRIISGEFKRIIGDEKR